MRTVNFVIVKDIEDQPLIIRDVGPWDKHPTVTNAAEDVVRELIVRGHLPEGRQLFYYDSEGKLDELLVKDGLFAGFRRGPGAIPFTQHYESRRMQCIGYLSEIRHTGNAREAAMQINRVYGTFDDMAVLALGKAIEVFQGRITAIQAADQIELVYKKNWSATRKKRKPVTDPDSPDGGIEIEEAAN